VLPALPGTVFIFLGLLVAAWIDHFERVGWVTLVVLGVLTLLSLSMDYVASTYGVRRSGASKQAIAGSAVGTIVGLFFGIPGIILGPFIGAMIGELIARRDMVRAGRAGLVTWLGLVLGMALKLALAFTMIGIFIIVYIAGS
jgi:hypothetical protein